ncbi:VanZ like family protein [compost metagenome]
MLGVAAATIAIITVVELTQMLTKVGSFDIDDIILNTCGALIGFVLFKLRVRSNKNQA